jgi:23S rRNA-/tRNA-specific pseudouridylate synthase
LSRRDNRAAADKNLCNRRNPWIPWLFAKGRGVVETCSKMFEGRQMDKTYLAVVPGGPPDVEWTCELKLAPDPKRGGQMRVDARHGKPAETQFRLLKTHGDYSLVEARPVTGRTHQIRVPLAETGLPIVGDELYGSGMGNLSPGLRAVQLAYFDPFTGERVEIHAPTENVLKEFEF